MFSVTIGSDEYRVQFSHSPHEPEEPSACSISENGELIAIGVSPLLPNNRYSRNARRKTAMAEALYWMGFPKELRILFWQAYHDKRGRW